MYKAYKFRMYLTDSQRVLVHKTFGCCRFVYNYFLNKCKENGYQNGYINGNRVYSEYSVRPVIVLDADTLVTSSGTSSDPFIVS